MKKFLARTKSFAVGIFLLKNPCASRRHAADTAKDLSSHRNSERGDVMILIVLLVSIVSLMVVPFAANVAKELSVARTRGNREEALQIAEAGVNYYQWHLAHFPSDYQDGQGATSTGPYLHTYTDLDTQQVLGYYSLSITPPPTGSTIVTIVSTGWTAANPNVTRTITTRYGIPSLAAYAFLSNDTIWIGSNETVSGKMHANNGIRFDGTGNAPVESAKTTYTCPSSQGSPCPTTENGVWGSAPASTQAYWNFPVPAIDFSSVTGNLATIKSDAQSAGIYLSPSNKSGYSLVFNANGTVSIYTVTSTQNEPQGQDINGKWYSTSDYKNRTLLYTKSIPSNGIIYIEDTTWVEGTVHGRVTVAASKLPYNPNTAPDIFIANNIVYSAKDGSDVLGLIAQDNVIVSYGAPNTLEIDGALVAQNGSVENLYYQSGHPNKNAITVYGSIISYNAWTWSWVNNGGQTVSGYGNTTDAYDSNLLYGPPPDFPLSTAGYKQLSWTSN